MNRAGYEGLRPARPERRPFIVSRSGWAGMQRWAWNWTGDAASTWESMRQQIATVVGLGLSGVPVLGVRHRRLQRRPRRRAVPAVAADERVHALLPHPLGARRAAARAVVLRRAHPTHRGGVDPVPVPAAAVSLHAGAPGVGDGRAPASARCGGPAPTSSTERRDRHRRLDVDDAFLLGDALLVAPVTEPGARRRAVALPRRALGHAVGRR